MKCEFFVHICRLSLIENKSLLFSAIYPVSISCWRYIEMVSKETGIATSFLSPKIAIPGTSYRLKVIQSGNVNSSISTLSRQINYSPPPPPPGLASPSSQHDDDMMCVASVIDLPPYPPCYLLLYFITRSLGSLLMIPGSPPPPRQVIKSRTVPSVYIYRSVSCIVTWLGVQRAEIFSY